MINRILKLEKDLFKIEYISNHDWLDQVIHDRFIECGQSGQLYNKQDTMEALLACIEDRKIEIYNYDFQVLNDNAYLVHYVTKSNENLIYRTSIWVKEENLKILFHQATKLNQDIELKIY